MKLNEFERLKKKIDIKDFENNNKGLNTWLFRFSYLGNLGSILFAFYLVYDAFNKTISATFGSYYGNILAMIITSLVLSVFEIIKRYLIKNSSIQYVQTKTFAANTLKWLIFTISILSLSGFLTIKGSIEFAVSRGMIIGSTVDNAINIKTDSINNIITNKIYFLEQKDSVYQSKLDSLNLIRSNKNSKNLAVSIDEIKFSIKENKEKISELKSEIKTKVNILTETGNKVKKSSDEEGSKIILIFVLIAILIEFVIILGIYFREYYEFKVYEINHKKFEKLYLKKERYKSLLSFVYDNGKLNVEDKVISVLAFKEIVASKTTISNSGKLVDEFYREMDSLGVFSTVGKRRIIMMTYDEAIDIVENLDDSLLALENMK